MCAHDRPQLAPPPTDLLSAAAAPGPSLGGEAYGVVAGGPLLGEPLPSDILKRTQNDLGARTLCETLKTSTLYNT